MLIFVLRRVVQSAVVMAVVTVIAFGLFNFTGDPVAVIIHAVNFVDTLVMAAYLCFIALMFVLLNLVVDLLYCAVDPRLRVERPGFAAT